MGRRRAGPSASRGRPPPPVFGCPCRLAWSQRQRPRFRWHATAVQTCLGPLQLALGVEPPQQRAPPALRSPVLRPDLPAAPAGRGGAIRAGQLRPGTAGLEHVQEAVDGPAVIRPTPTRPRLWRGEERFDDGPVVISELVSAHAHSLAWAHRMLKWLVKKPVFLRTQPLHCMGVFAGAKQRDYFAESL